MQVPAVATPVSGYLNLDLVPASLTLERVEVELAGVLDAQFILSDKLETVKDDYDLIVIDTPPSLNVIVSNALTAADKLIIPVQADIYSFKGMATLAQRVKAIQRRSNPRLSNCGIVLNRYNPALT
ncbi:ParA family protein [Lactobacillus delbrueckii]|uniref:ParA family protein n=1 Tax=Lactobacillus delbrueckii TaxID=1584 RepID=UPI0035CFB68F